MCRKCSELMIGIFMAQLHPTGDLNLDRTFVTLAYQAIQDWPADSSHELW